MLSSGDAMRRRLPYHLNWCGLHIHPEIAITRVSCLCSEVWMVVECLRGSRTSSWYSLYRPALHILSLIALESRPALMHPALEPNSNQCVQL